ncbi:MAG: metal ABC transporter substrate-binding protein, partial [Chloroflexota bacterium]
MFRKPILLVVSLALLLAACASPATSTANKLKIVATYSTLGDLVQNVGGDRIELHTLVGPGLDT